MEAALSDVIQFEEALGNITDKPMDSNNLVSVKVDIFEESPYFFKYLHCLNMNRAAVVHYCKKLMGVVVFAKVQGQVRVHFASPRTFVKTNTPFNSSQ